MVYISTPQRVGNGEMMVGGGGAAVRDPRGGGTHEGGLHQADN